MNGVGGPSAPLPRCPPWGRPGEQAPSQRAELEGSLALGAGPSSLQGRPRARSCVHGLCEPRKAQGPGRPGALVDAGLVASKGP